MTIEQQWVAADKAAAEDRVTIEILNGLIDAALLLPDEEREMQLHAIGDFAGIVGLRISKGKLEQMQQARKI